MSSSMPVGHHPLILGSLGEGAFRPDLGGNLRLVEKPKATYFFLMGREMNSVIPSRTGGSSPLVPLLRVFSFFFSVKPAMNSQNVTNHAGWSRPNPSPARRGRSAGLPATLIALLCSTCTVVGLSLFLHLLFTFCTPRGLWRTGINLWCCEIRSSYQGITC